MALLSRPLCEKQGCCTPLKGGEKRPEVTQLRVAKVLFPEFCVLRIKWFPFPHRKVTPLYPRWSSAKQRAELWGPYCPSCSQLWARSDLVCAHFWNSKRTHGISFTLTSTAFFRLWDSGMFSLLLFLFRFALHGLFVWWWESLSIPEALKSPSSPEY